MSFSDFLSSTAGVLTVTCVGIIFASVAFARAKGNSASIPNVSISLGIMFTFIGICLALIGFNPDDIQGSIPELLDGMRLAFITSIFGMGVAILYRVTPLAAIWISENARSQGKGATMETLAHHLLQIEKALVGEGDATLNTQLQKLRLAFVEKQDEMTRAFREFAEKVANDNTQALILAIEEVMRDFNAKINEQLGDNFRKFNDGLGRMLEWQEEYKSQMDTMILQVNHSLEAVKACEKVVVSIEERSRSFSTTAEKLGTVVEAYHREIQNLEAHLKAFSDTAQRAQNAFPEIEQNLKHLTEGFGRGVTQATESMKVSLEAQQQVLRRIVQESSEELQATTREQREIVRKMTEETSEHIAKQIEVLDQELGTELTKALSTLGSQLASLSNQFVADYTPLTQQLRRLVQSAANSNAGRDNGSGQSGISA